MAYSPVEIRHIKLRRSLVGYRRASVDKLLGDIAESFEAVWRDRADLADEVERLQGELAHHREHEQLLRTTLVSAERAAHELKEQAKREAEVILAEAHAEARAVTRAAQAERERLLADIGRLRALLEAALGLTRDAEPPKQDGEEVYPSGWPKLEETADVTPLPRDERRTA
jgi:cell division initiation protein